ncbi:MAG: hypothetical protein WCX69_01475 [Candidatus Paceibacterota bacterium]
MKIIVTLPHYDPATQYISNWAKNVVDFAINRGIDVINLVGDKANRKDFEGRVDKVKPRIVFLNGYGDDDCVLGQDNLILVKKGDNHTVLQGKITYALACSSGAELGPEVAKNNDSAYIGYDDEFCFAGNSKYLSHPIDDPRAKPFMESSNQIMCSLLKGNNCQEACEKSRKIFKEYINRLSSSAADPDSLQDAQLLWWDMKHQVCLGNKRSSIKD